MEIYAHDTYQGFLSEWIQNYGTRGGRSALARAAQCSASWMTRALNRKAELSLDQAYGIALFLNLNESETEYFFLLVELGGASSSRLKDKLREKISAIQKDARNLKRSVKADPGLEREHMTLYYSSWIYAAIHVFCMIRPRSVNEIAERFRLRRAVTELALRSLKDMGLMSVRAGSWSAGTKIMHLSGSTLTNVNHSNWRSRTAQHLQDNDNEGLHYTGVHCLSEKDFEAIRKILKEAILSSRRMIEPSPSETVAVFSLDWYVP